MNSAMDRDEALASLTPTYAEALRLRASGCSDVEIATRLEIDAESVGALLYLAAAKLERLVTSARPDER